MLFLETQIKKFGCVMLGRKINRGFVNLQFVVKIDMVEVHCRNICFKSVVLTVERFSKFE